MNFVKLANLIGGRKEQIILAYVGLKLTFSKTFFQKAVIVRCNYAANVLVANLP